MAAGVALLPRGVEGAVAGEAAAPVARGGRAYPPVRARLNRNENPFGPPESALRAAAEAARRGNRYPLDSDYESLERAIAEREGVARENVLLGWGSGAVLCVLGAAYVRDGEMVAATPTFFQLPRYVAALGGRVRELPLDPSGAHDLAAMAAAVRGDTRLVYVVNPNNPTGTVTPSAPLRSFCDELSRRVPVVVDEAYLEYAAPEVDSMIGLVRAGRDVIVVRTFSKIYALAGMRVGYALARPETVRRLRPFGMGELHVSAVAAAAAALADREFVRVSRRRNDADRERLERILRRSGFRLLPSRANFVMAEVGRPAQEFQADMLARGILVGGGWPGFERWSRITVGRPEELDALEGALAEVAS
jgi:histidinol-phosphate aminotransferase